MQRTDGEIAGDPAMPVGLRTRRVRDSAMNGTFLLDSGRFRFPTGIQPTTDEIAVPVIHPSSAEDLP